MATLTGLVFRGGELLALCVFDYLPGSEHLGDNLGLSYFCLLDFSPTRGVGQMLNSCVVAGVMGRVSRPPSAAQACPPPASAVGKDCAAPRLSRQLERQLLLAAVPLAALLRGLQAAVFRGGCPRQPGLSCPGGL